MTKHELPSQDKKQKGGKQRADEKKLHKHELRLLERLQGAQAKQEKAQANLERAEARFQKRRARVQRLEERLIRVRQQLGVEQEPAFPSQPPATGAPPEEPATSTFAAENMTGDVSLAVAPLPSAQTSDHVPAPENAPTSSSSDISTTGSVAPIAPPSSEAAQPVRQERAVAVATEEEVRAATERAVAASAASHEKSAQSGPKLEELQRVAEIAQEEELLEEGVARTHAEAVAIAAAEAEALAESSSARTRKARILARQADQELTLVRATIRNGSLTGEKADAALQAAERKSTHAHAELDDAEEAEERAISAARNAEAEAEVAEEMAFSAYDRAQDDVDVRAVQAIAEQEQQREGFAHLNAEADERTEKRPVVRPQVLRE
jgi:hypothetical protein